MENLFDSCNMSKLCDVCSIATGNKDYYIPSYQRGYRWRPQEVVRLLDDLLEFVTTMVENNKHGYYCLQPLVLFTDENRNIVVDGQQRLTTIFLIMKALQKRQKIDENDLKMTFSYETRPEMTDFLQDIQNKKQEDVNNIEKSFVYEAYQAISQWLDNTLAQKTRAIRDAFIYLFVTEDEGNKTSSTAKFILYMTAGNRTAQVRMFTRLNYGKIDLTNAELIKAAIFISLKNCNIIVRNAFAQQWNELENRLQDNGFWYFLYNRHARNAREYQIRMDYLFELFFQYWSSTAPGLEMCPHDLLEKISKLSSQNMDDVDKYLLFDIFQNYLATQNNADGAWEIFWIFCQRIYDWHHNRVFHHLIGYMVQIGFEINTIASLLDSTTATGVKYSKSEQEILLRQKIREKLNLKDDLAYFYDKPGDREIILQILLLFNVETILANPHSTYVFPFEQYQCHEDSINEDSPLRRGWDLEHISSITTTITRLGDMNPWLSCILGHYLGYPEAHSSETEEENTEQNTKLIYINKLREKREHFDEKLYQILSQMIDLRYAPKSSGRLSKEFGSLYQEMFKYLGEYDYVSKGDNSIGNLTLLDSTTNRSYQNAPYIVKRGRILQREMYEVFVPPCTKNVFLKQYSVDGSKLVWSQEDSQAYLSAIRKVLESQHYIMPIAPGHTAIEEA